MAFTYDYTATTYPTDRDWLRLLIGDTQAAYWKFQDEELDNILSQTTTVEQAQGMCFEIMAQDPDRLVRTRDATAGAFTLLSLMQLYAARAAELQASS